jgi:hypothetical protein
MINRRHVVYLLLLIRLVDIKIYTKRKMEKEEKHWEVGNSNMTMSHKKDGSYNFPIFNVEVKSKWKTYWSLYFVGLTTRKLKRKEMSRIHSQWPCLILWPLNIVYHCLLLQLLDILLWKVVFRVLETRRKNEMTMRQIKRWSEKSWCHESCFNYIILLSFLLGINSFFLHSLAQCPTSFSSYICLLICLY